MPVPLLLCTGSIMMLALPLWQSGSDSGSGTVAMATMAVNGTGTLQVGSGSGVQPHQADDSESVMSAREPATSLSSHYYY